jgi:hypothetical protein
MSTIYPALSIPAPRRLAIFRAEAAEKHWARPMTQHLIGTLARLEKQ